MQNECIYCNFPMIKTKSWADVQHGEARQFAKYVCANPDCRHEVIMDSPNDD